MYAKITKSINVYQVYFKGKLINTFKTEKEAEKEKYRVNIDYYSKNKNELPKGIRYDKTQKRFRFEVRLDNKKLKPLMTSKDLGLLIEARKKLLFNLLDLYR